MPGWLGGLGMVRPNDWDDLQDRMTALSIMKSINKLKDSTRMSSFDTPKKVSDEPSWIMYQRVQDQFRQDFSWLDSHPYRSVEYEGTTRDLSQENQNYRKWKIIELLFTHQIDNNPYGITWQPYRDVPFQEQPGIFQGYNIDPYYQSRMILQHNERCWATHTGRVLNIPSLNKECFLRAPEYEDLLNVKIEDNSPIFENRLARPVCAHGAVLDF
jgi:hypothetical protein